MIALYAWYCVAASLRYFVIAGLAYGFFHVWFRSGWVERRIQTAFPGRDEIAHEIRWSMVTIACGGLAGLALYRLIERGWTRVYFDVRSHGWTYFGFSVLLAVVGYDAWFYWKHRLLHTAWFFRSAHRVHHRITNPTPFANFTHHPLEIALSNAYFVVLVLVVPVHPLALGLVSTFVFGWGMVAHLGYELYPATFTRGRLFRWINSATHHNMHHSHVSCNYGLFFNYWDRLLGTNHPHYRDMFETIGRVPTATRHRATSALVMRG